ncbi:MAG: menaquinone biosynthesis protein [Planctomycetes bacterium]|nr:menaquinone biosynthesis protein [Planctomycetota bacterium]
MQGTLRVGTPPYLVARPLNLGLEREPGLEVVHEVPARLVERLRAGELDVALVSSIELFRAPGYRYVPGAAVLGRGRVSSVQVFLRKPFDALRDVVLDPASRAAQTLVRVLLTERLGRERVAFREPDAGADPRVEAERSGADAWLAIGDAALRTKLAPDAPESFDPAAAWVQETALPFAFAVWIVRPGVELEPRHVAGFLAARDRGRAAIPELARESSRRWNLPEDACLRYLADECGFAPGPELQRSLELFRDRAAALELARAELPAVPVHPSESSERHVPAPR